MKAHAKTAHHNSGSAVYGLGIIGALFYYIPLASGFVDFFIAIFKSLFWPGFLVYEALKFLGA